MSDPLKLAQEGMRMCRDGIGGTPGKKEFWDSRGLGMQQESNLGDHVDPPISSFLTTVNYFPVGHGRRGS